MSARYRPGTAAVTGEHRRRPASQPGTASAGSAEMAKIMTSIRKPFPEQLDPLHQRHRGDDQRVAHLGHDEQRGGQQRGRAPVAVQRHDDAADAVDAGDHDQRLGERGHHPPGGGEQP
jgi:hypothetical protein